MSVVICYSCDKFSMIATDTMITCGDGSRSYESKVYPLYPYGLGHCAGVGFGKTIYNVRDNLNNLKEVNSETIITAIKSGYVDSIEEYNNSSIFSTQVAVSLHTVLTNNNKVKYNVVTFEYREDNQLYSERIQLNKLEIMYPSTYGENKNLYQSFIDTHNLEYTYNGDFNCFLLFVVTIFQDIYKDSKSVVSDICEITLSYFRNDSNKIEPRQFATKVSTLIENCENKLYTLIESEINEQQY